MAATSIAESLIQDLDGYAKAYCLNLDALTEAQRAESAGSVARTPYDFTYEVVVVNRRMAQRLRGEDPGPWTFQGFVTAPEDFKNLESAKAAIFSSMQEVAANVGDPARMIQTSEGPEPAIGVINFVIAHTSYHFGQLALLQSLGGDNVFHFPR
jgi:uncharacterized damage-inducible protein DinB